MLQTLEVSKIQEISQITKNILASEEAIRSMDLARLG